jgi:NAD-dependent deacetylase
LFHYDSSREVARKTKLLIIVGTSGATHLPSQIVNEVFWRGGTIMDINLEKNPFSRFAIRSSNGRFIQQTSSKALSEILKIFKL